MTRCSALLSLCILPGAFSGFCQVTIEVGTGTIVNPVDQAPSPYANYQNGSRNQLLFTVDELEAAGMGPGTIVSLGFNVAQESGTTLIGYSGFIGTTNANSLTNTWEAGLFAAWNPGDFTPGTGWTLHQLDFPFYWDGASNLVIETCYTNGSATQNATVHQTATDNVSCVARNSFNPAICVDGGGTHVPFQQRPNVRFGWLPVEAPPVAAFTANPQFSCTGDFTFTDASGFFPDEWAWNFGDDSTSTDQNAVHTYLNSGTYTVTLVVTNAFGSDTASMDVSVDLSGSLPLPACDAMSVGTVEGFGILEVTIEGSTFTTADAVDDGGYVDHTCGTISVVQGTLLELSVTTANAASHAVRAWLDLDNSGSFTANELVLSGMGPSLIGSTLIGSGAVLDAPLRLRIIATYDLVTPDPQACGDVQYGQAEDFSITVLPNLEPPIASFSASPVFSCEGTVQFTDLSLNTPTAWAWDFGDSGISDEQDPQHTYSASGTYSVTLTVLNANGQDDTLAVGLITIDLGAQLIPASCTPNTTAYCCGYGILGFQFAGINSTSGDASEGYQDRSCGNTASVQEGSAYPWSLTTTAATPHDTRIWIDMDNDGAFTAAELIGTALDQSSPSGIATIPFGSVFGTPVRLRVQSDVIGQSSDPCDAPLFGQIEDFSVIVEQNTSPPTAAFSVSPSVTCDGLVQFTDQSTNLPDNWNWTFGDGNSSVLQNPQHTYLNPGTYTVSLNASNAFGSDATVLPGAVTSVPGWQCDTMQMDGADNTFSNACLGVLSDDGGPEGNYTGGTSGAFTIAPTGAVHVTLDFSQFAWGTNPVRWLAIYDGPDVFSPLIDNYTGNGIGQLPNGGVITSTGSSITLRQEQQGGGGAPPNSAGFLLTWNCSLTGIEEGTIDPFVAIRPQPADDGFIVDLHPTTATRTLLLRDALGREVQQRTVTGIQAYFDVSTLAAGAYVLHVTETTASWARTIIIR